MGSRMNLSPAMMLPHTSPLFVTSGGFEAAVQQALLLVVPIVPYVIREASSPSLKIEFVCPYDWRELPNGLLELVSVRFNHRISERHIVPIPKKVASMFLKLRQFVPFTPEDLLPENAQAMELAQILLKAIDLSGEDKQKTTEAQISLIDRVGRFAEEAQEDSQEQLELKSLAKVLLTVVGIRIPEGSFSAGFFDNMGICFERDPLRIPVINATPSSTPNSTPRFTPQPISSRCPTPPLEFVPIKEGDE